MGDEDEDDDLERAYTAGAGSKSESKRAEGKRSIDGRGEPGVGMGTKSTRRVEDIREEKARAAMEEEERRVAALTFDDDALLPFDDMRERAKYIPLRLSYEERKVGYGMRALRCAVLPAQCTVLYLLCRTVMECD